MFLFVIIWLEVDMKTDQLEFESLAETLTESQLLNKKLDETIESLGKVRRKLFAEVGLLKTQIALLQKDNESLQSQIAELRGDKIEFEYRKSDGFLFEMKAG